MARTVEVTVPSERTDDLVRELQCGPALLGLRVQRGVSLDPPGDVVSASLLTENMNDPMSLLDRWGAGRGRAVEVLTTAPTSLIKGEAERQAIARDAAGSTWEEMETEIGP
jgi:hypothetical protein